MAEEVKRFPLRVLLTVTTGRLLTKARGPHDNGIGDLYKILNWMTRDDLMTHQLPRAGDECGPWLLRWFPELAKADAQLERLDSALARVRSVPSSVEDVIVAWLESLGLKVHYDVPRIPADDHERKHPFDELVEMRGTDEGIIPIVIPEQEGGTS